MEKKALFFLPLVLVLALTFSISACKPNDKDSSSQGSGGRETYTVYFNDNYPSGGRTTQFVEPGEKAVRPDDPVREGFVFAGWYDEYEDGEEYNFHEPVTGDLRLYAYWISSAFFVTFKFNNGDADEVRTVETFSVVERPDDPENEGYDFTGWYTDAANTKPYDFTVPVSASFSLYAGWRRSSVSVTFNLNYAGAPESLRLNVKVGAAIVLPDSFDAERRLYELEGWYDKAYPAAADEAYDLAEGVADDVILYAKWKRTAYLVTFDPNVTGMQSVEVEVPVETGVAAVPDFSRTGYTLDENWYTTTALTETFDLNSVRDDVVIFAKWNINSYKIEFDLNYPEAPAAPEDQSVTYLGYVLRPEVPERSGYLFLGWYTEAEAGIQFNFEATAVTGAFTLFARWQEKQDEPPAEITVTFLYNFPALGSVYSTATIDYGTALSAARMPADPALPGYWMFIGWYREAYCENEFSPQDVLIEDTEVYARILAENRFEAEYVNLKDKHGVGSSVELNEEAMIFNFYKIGNGTGMGAEEVSNDYYVAGLYQKGLYIEFEVVASREITDAVFVMRVSSEFKELHHNPLTPETYRIDVVPESGYSNFATKIANNETMEDYIFYYELPLTLPPPNTDKENDPDGEKTPFETVIISYHLHLYEGKNYIRLTTYNEYDYGAGTFKANAPMIDYISVYAEIDAIIEMIEYTEFLYKSEAYAQVEGN